jgi:hypothetical protein
VCDQDADALPARLVADVGPARDPESLRHLYLSEPEPEADASQLRRLQEGATLLHAQGDRHAERRPCV